MTARLFLLAALALVPACPRSTPATAPGNTAATPVADGPLVPSFWDGRSRAGASRACTPDDYRGLTARSPATAWAEALSGCWLDWESGGDAPDPDSLGATVAFATALLDAGFPHDCIDELSPVITPYPGGLESREIPPELEDAAAEAMALGERCEAAAAAQVAMFAVCPSPDACFELDTRYDDAAAAADEFYVACPEVVQRTPGGERRFAVDGGPLVDPGFCCGISSVSTYARGDRRYLLVQPSGEDSMFIRVCGAGGGTASSTPAAIYRIDGDRLVLDSDRSITWH